MFKYPLVGLYVYLQPAPSPHFPARLRIIGISLLILEVGVQIGQYLTGEKVGDNLAGILGSG